MNFLSQTSLSSTAHLSEEALDTVLLGDASAAERQHLAACEACAGRVAAFRASLAMFNQASAGWSEARSNTISRELPQRKLSHTTAAAWSLASVTILAVGLAFSNQFHRSPDLAASGVQESENASNRQQEIASDNAMLVAIDSEISQPVPSPVAVDGIGASATPETQQTATREVRD